MFRLVLLGALLALVQAQSTNVQRCVLSQGELPVNAYVVGCSRTPCRLQSRVDAELRLTFRPNRAITRMTTRVQAQLPFGTFPFPLFDQSATCNYLANRSCPVRAGETLHYSLRLNIPAVAAGNSANIELSITDESHRPVTCIRVPVIVS